MFGRKSTPAKISAPPVATSNGTSAKSKTETTTSVNRARARTAHDETSGTTAKSSPTTIERGTENFALVNMPDGYRARGIQSHTEMVQRTIIYLLIVFCGYREWSHYRTIKDAMQKQYMVYMPMSNGETQVFKASDFRTKATDVEIRGTALKAVGMFLGVGGDPSKENYVETNYRKVREMMTDAMAKEFEQKMRPRADKIKSARVYSKLEDGEARQMTASDVSPTDPRPTRYDVIVKGRLDTYRSGTEEVLASGPFAYHVRLVALEERTEENTTGLLVDGIEDYQSPDKTPSKAETSGDNGKAKSKDQGADQEPK